ncbi:MIB2-like protein [Mya arenaria]|uniref:Poly [ADP-ribose] polymerase n=1 Tax=Mya arenaria TaxID=6604 RepID=A0ABY7EV55_MYAAR|nr:MIB2-like protein [Mya arenaria]
MQAGVRVIRGPDWQSKKQDGGEGHVGTVIYVPKAGSSDDHVTVVWDNGRELRYRAGKDGKYDLRVLDNAQAGVIQDGIVCDECREDPVAGIRWKCGVCNDYDLCSACYMAGKHDTSHAFMRIAHPKTQAGAKVMRGPHWKWKNDDGGNSENGEVTSVVPWQKKLPRSAVTVRWRQTKKEGTYRLGAEGCVDVVYEECTSGGKYYHEHLPLVDTVNEGEITLKNSDKVRVSLDKDSFKRLQEHEAYGGWSEGLTQCFNETGTIVKLLYEGKAARVQYTDSKTWTVNRHALFRIHSFSPGEAVTIIDEVNTARELQEGHGGWNDDMTDVGPRVWIYSPVCCRPVEDPALAKTAPELSKSEMEHGEMDDLGVMRRDMQRVADQLADLFVGLLKAVPDADDSGDMAVVEAASKGDLPRVKAAVDKDPRKVDAVHEHKTALQLASYEGKLAVVQFLLDRKADVNKVDEEGDTALHFAAFGQEESCMKVLLKAGARPDVQNQKGQTSIHITIGKGALPCTKLLLAHKASVNIKDKDGDTPLHDCIIQTRKALLLVPAVFKSASPDFTVENARGFNVLQWAALKNNKAAAEIILDRKVDIKDRRMTEGFAALHICAANDHVEIASLLIKVKCNLDVLDNHGRTPLHIAVSQGNKRSVELLLTVGCKVDVQDDDGNTALHVAQISRALPDQLARLLGVPLVNDDTGIQISCLLAEAGAAVTVKNKKGDTPLDLCSDTATREFIKRLADRTGKGMEKAPTTRRGVFLPAHWESMEREDVVRRIHLNAPGASGLLQKEFQEVQNKFRRTMPQARILKVERIQSKFLWEHYFFKRNQMEADYGKGCTNELDLYHGTKADLVETICIQSLDPRLAGENVGTLFGQGTYFATEAKYSDGYAEPDKDRHKFLFQCRVLAGKWTYGDPKYKRPPVMDGPVKKGSVAKLYDCCVDNINKPKIFCLFDINQYYPEYVIEYQ